MYKRNETIELVHGRGYIQRKITQAATPSQLSSESPFYLVKLPRLGMVELSEGDLDWITCNGDISPVVDMLDHLESDVNNSFDPTIKAEDALFHCLEELEDDVIHGNKVKYVKQFLKMFKQMQQDCCLIN